MQDTHLLTRLQDDQLKVVPDLTRFSKKFQTGNGNLQDVARVYQLVIRLPAILDTLKVVGEEEHTERHRQIILDTYAKPLEVRAYGTVSFRTLG